MERMEQNGTSSITKKINNMKKVMFTTTILLMIMGCQKSTSLQRAADEAMIILSNNFTDERAANADNPMDWMGSRHNKLLDSAVLFVRHNRISDLQSIYGSMQKFYPKFVSADAARIHEYLPGITPHLQKALLKNADSLIRTRIKDPLTREYPIAIISTLRTIATADYSKTKSRLVSIEKQIQSDQRLSESERRMLLSMSSVARYSFSYWLDRSASEPSETMGFLRWLGAAANAAVADASAVALCYALLLPVTWWADIASAVSTGAYGTVMGW